MHNVIIVCPPGQHRLALMQTRKDHSRLEKALLQQQRDLRRLEEAYKITKAGMQLFKKKGNVAECVADPWHKYVKG